MTLYEMRDCGRVSVVANRIERSTADIIMWATNPYVSFRAN